MFSPKKELQDTEKFLAHEERRAKRRLVFWKIMRVIFFPIVIYIKLKDKYDEWLYQKTKVEPINSRKANKILDAMLKEQFYHSYHPKEHDLTKEDFFLVGIQGRYYYLEDCDQDFYVSGQYVKTISKRLKEYGTVKQDELYEYLATQYNNPNIECFKAEGLEDIVRSHTGNWIGFYDKIAFDSEDYIPMKEAKAKWNAQQEQLKNFVGDANYSLPNEYERNLEFILVKFKKI